LTRGLRFPDRITLARTPSRKILETAMAEAKPRIRLDKKEVRKGETVDVKTLVSHIMETGFRKDAGGKPIARMIINIFTCELNGKFVFGCDLESAVSANPYFEFKFKPTESGTLKFTWIDDEGTRIEASETITVT
jgi:sulfur-oxidizing protein SoxZ